MRVDVQRLGIERHVGEQHVVHLRHGSREAMADELADAEVFEVEPAARMRTAVCLRRHGVEVPSGCRVQTSFTITAPCCEASHIAFFPAPGPGGKSRYAQMTLVDVRTGGAPAAPAAWDWGNDHPPLSALGSLRHGERAGARGGGFGPCL